MFDIEYPRPRWEQPGLEVAAHTNSAAVWWPWIDTVVVHYPGCSSCVPAPTAANMINSIQRTQRDYVLNRGYSVGYNFLVCPNGDIIEGRGFDFMNAANYYKRPWGDKPDANGNYHSISIQVKVNGDGQTAPAANTAQVAAVNAIITEVERRAGRTVNVIGHRDTKPTSCPGNAIYQQIQQGVFGATPVEPPTPPPALPGGTMSTRTYVLDDQQRIYEETVGHGAEPVVLLPYDASVGMPVAATVTLTAANATGQGHLRAGQPSLDMPATSSLNFSSDHPVANTTMVRVVPFSDGNPALQMWVRGPESVRVIVDLIALHYT
jgi:hypothetical protein